jgi:two-component system phosphate regulon response regulator OmpR
VSTILVIDESAICREPLAAILEARGHRVLRSANAHEARTILGSLDPDLILMDLAMHGTDGLELLEFIRAHPRHKERPIILITACGDKGTILAARALGVQGYLLKTSFSVEQLFLRMNACLAGSTPPGPTTAAAA